MATTPIPTIVDLGCLVRGDTFRAVTIGPILIDEATPASALASVELGMFPARGEVVKHGRSTRLPSHKFETTITDAANWMVKIDSVDVFDALPAGKWHGFFRVTDAAGVTTTLYDMTLEIVSDH